MRQLAIGRPFDRKLPHADPSALLPEAAPAMMVVMPTPMVVMAAVAVLHRVYAGFVLYAFDCFSELLLNSTGRRGHFR